MVAVRVEEGAKQDEQEPKGCLIEGKETLWGAFLDQLPSEVRHDIVQVKVLVLVGLLLLGTSAACFIFFLTTGTLAFCLCEPQSMLTMWWIVTMVLLSR
jgi:hypothetical protein